MRSTFEYWDGAIWQTETQRVRCTITDTLYYPMAIDVMIGNPLSNRENIYSRYQRVRIAEFNTSRIIFYGKIETIEPDFDNVYGQVLKIFARDNLQELLKRINNTNYTGLTTRSALISQIVGDHSFFSGSITNISRSDTQKFETSIVLEPATQLNVNYSGSGKTAIRSISELAVEDPWATPSTGFGFIFYLDQEFNGNTPTPDLHYFRRGNRPSGGPATRGLIVQYGSASETNTSRTMLPDYRFDIESHEIITIVRIEYFTSAGASVNIRCQLLNISGLAGGWAVGNTITGGTSGTTATVEHIGSGFLIVSSWSGLFTNNEALSSSGGGTATFTNAPRQEIQQDIEYILRGYNITAADEARDKAAQILYHGGDSPFRGYFRVNRWPYVTITGTHGAAFSNTVLTDAAGDFLNWGIRAGDIVTNTTNTIDGTITGVTATTITVSAGGMSWDTGDAYRIYNVVRSGHTIRVINSNVPNLPQDMLVTKIRYDEGAAAIISEIEVVGTARGVEAPRHAFVQIEEEKADTALWQTPAAAGGVAEVAQLVNLSFVFSTPAYNQISWPGGTATYSDGSTLAINATGSPFTIPNDNLRYIYLISGNSTLQTTESFSNVVGITNSLVAIAFRNSDVNEDAQIVTVNGGTPRIAANTIIANELSAISANMGLLRSGEIRVGTGVPASGTFTGHRIYLSGGIGIIEGQNAGTVKWRANTSGELTAGGGSVVLDETGVHYKASISVSAAQFENVGFRTVLLYNDGAGNFVITPTGAGTAVTSINSYLNTFLFSAASWEIGSLSVPSTGILGVGAAGTVRPSVGGANLGAATQYWGNAYLDTVLVNTLNERTAGNDIRITNGVDIISATAGGSNLGNATQYFGSLYVGQNRNRITGSVGDIDFRVADTAGSSDVLAMYIADGDAPTINIPLVSTLRVFSEMRLDDITAGTSVFRITATSDVPVSNPATDAPAGWIEISVGGVPRYIPFYT